MKETLKRMLARYVNAMRHGDHYDEFHKLLNLLRQSKDEKTTIFYSISPRLPDILGRFIINSVSI